VEKNLCQIYIWQGINNQNMQGVHLVYFKQSKSKFTQARNGILRALVFLAKVFE
jgi:hypothetical protein